MFDLEAAFRDWRAHIERGTTLSPREVDELEDHLRARIDLELELDEALTTARAFSLARHDLGEPKTLSREFAKAGKPRWRRLLLVGCGMFAVSWFLPALGDATGRLWGWEAFLVTLEWRDPVDSLSALANILRECADFCVNGHGVDSGSRRRSWPGRRRMRPSGR
ncbi:hypothetical protein [Candidatus Palauibacter sp.]|uniref:hypothetical protein n=1 Tax=Candidatus Palauibacter sp. TaxID=3101350 RepID=UPI003B5A8BB8